MRRGLGTILFVLPCGLAATAACTLPESPDLPLTVSTTKTVGTAGGTVTTSDGNASVEIPPGALTTDTTITITANASAPAPGGVTTVGTAYVFGPDGLKFAKPVTVTLPFDASKLPSGTTASRIVVYTAPDGTTTYEPLETSVKDDTHVVASTVHFSTDVAGVAGTSTGGGGKVCAPGGERCSGTAGSGPGCGADTPKCATASCRGYPGAQVEDCVEDATGYDAKCCFPEGTPTCFPTGEGRTCGEGTPCPPAPSCATSTPCGTYAGATVQSCTDNPNGYNAICCLPPGSPVPGVSSGDGGTSSGTTDGGKPSGGGGDDASTGGGGSCVISAGGGGSGCEAMTDCNGHHYEMFCDGSMCTCMTDGQKTSTVSQGPACSGGSSVQAQFNGGCGYPGSGGNLPPPPPPPDGGATDAGSGGTCAPACGGSGTSCGCNSSCNGHQYSMKCTGTNCQCFMDGQPLQSFAQGAACSTSTDALNSFGPGGCGFPTQ